MPGLLKPLVEAGSGPQKVYVYFFETDRLLAGYENRSCWPCKIGHTTTSLEARIIGQNGTAMHSLPIIGLLIHTENSAWLERIIHAALRLADRTISGSRSLGTEWFNTTPDAVLAWYEQFLVSLSIFTSDIVSEKSI